MATSGNDLTSDEILQLKCCLCAKENRRREAEKYCLQCSDYYCVPCVGLHDDSPFTKGHKMLDKSDFRTVDKDANLPSIPTTRCMRHPTKVVDMFCEDHDIVACASCIALEHRCCKTVISVQDEVQHLLKTSALNETKLKIKEITKEMKHIQNVRAAKIEDQKEFFRLALEAVEEFMEELQSFLEEIKTATVKELQQRNDEIEASLVDDVLIMKKMLDSMDEAVLKLSQAEGNRAQEFVTIKISEKSITESETVLRAKRTVPDTAFNFIPDFSIKDQFQQIKLLGRVSVHNEINEEREEEAMPKDSLYKVKNRRQIDVRIQQDRFPCEIWGSSMTDDGNLLLADFNNFKVKCLDLNTEKVKNYVDLQARPLAVCPVSTTFAAVALNNNSVHFVSIGETMNLTRTICMNHYCSGLAYRSDKLFVTDNNKTLYIHDMSGKELQSISIDKSGKDIFQCNQIVQVMEDRVFVTDWYLGLVVFDIHGNCLTIVGKLYVNQLRGVCTDGRNVFVSDWTSGNIVQIGHDLKLLGDTGNCTNCKTNSLCFDRNRKALLAMGSQNELVVLELE